MKHRGVLGAGVALLLLMSACADSGPIEEGTWTGFVTPPGIGQVNSTFDVSYQGDAVQIEIDVDGLDRNFEFYEESVTDSTISFWWEPLMRVDCRLVSGSDGAFRGDCLDPDGGAGPIVMAPPGVTPLEYAQARQDSIDAVNWLRWGQLDEIDGPRGQMYDVEGTQLNALVQGDGPVSVVLIADVGDDLRTWDYVAHDVSGFARVMSYSRSGLGFSEEDEAATTLDHVTAELAGLLDAAGVEGPYVLVGHRFGAAFAQAFAAAHVVQVGGVVLVDPVHPALGDSLRQIDSASWTEYQSGQATLTSMMPESVQKEYALYHSVLEQGSLSGVGTLPDVPLVVLSGMFRPASARWVGETAQGLEVKRRLHEGMASSVAGGTHTVSEESGPYIQRQYPGLVIEAIRQVVDQIRPGA